MNARSRTFQPRILLSLALAGLLILPPVPARAAVFPWVDAFPGGTTTLGGIVADPAGDVIIDGAFSGSIDFDPHGVHQTMTTSGANPETFVARYRSDGTLAWIRTIGSTASSYSVAVALAEDADGNVYATGNFGGPLKVGSATYPNAGNNDIYLMKLSSAGDVQWVKTFGGSSYENGTGLAVDGSGNVYMTAMYEGSFTFAGQALTTDKTATLLAKLDRDGNVLWVKTYRATGGAVSIRSVAVNGSSLFLGLSFIDTLDLDGHAYTSAGSYDMLVAKLNPSDGTVIWSRAWGGSGIDLLRGVTVDASGNVFMTGQFSGTVDFGGASPLTAQYQDIVALKLGTDGQTIWAKGYGADLPDNPGGIAVDAHDRVFISGSYSAQTFVFGTTTLYNVGRQDGLVLELDSNGNPLNAVSFGGANADMGGPLAVTGDEQVALWGIYQGPTAFFGMAPISGDQDKEDGFLTQISLSQAAPVGTLYPWVWGTGPNGEASSLRTDTNGNIVVTGYVAAPTNFNPLGSAVMLNPTPGSNEGFIAKYQSADGHLVWVKGLSSTGSVMARGVATDDAGNIYTTGAFNGTMTIGAATYRCAGDSNDLDAFVAKFDASGNAVWVKTFDSPNLETGIASARDANNNVYVTMQYQGPVDVGGTMLPFAGTIATALIKLDASGNVVWSKSFTSNSAIASGSALGVDGSGNVIMPLSLFGTATINGQAYASAGAYDVLAADVDPTGAIKWVKRFGGTGLDMARAAAFGPDGSAYIAGQYSDTVDFDGNTLTSGGLSDAFVMKLSASDGHVVWAKGIGGTGYDAAFDVTMDGSGHPTIAGEFSNDVRFGATSVTSVSQNATDAFAASWDADGTPRWISTAGGAMSDSATSVAEVLAGTRAGDFAWSGFYQNASMIFDTSVIVASGNSNFFVGLIHPPAAQTIGPNRPPAFSASPSANPNPAAVGQAVAFTSAAADPDGDAVTFQWQFGDGGTATGPQVTHAYARPGTFTAQVEAVDPHGASAKATVQVVVQGAPGQEAPPEPNVMTKEGDKACVAGVDSGSVYDREGWKVSDARVENGGVCVQWADLRASGIYTLKTSDGATHKIAEIR